MAHPEVFKDPFASYEAGAVAAIPAPTAHNTSLWIEHVEEFGENEEVEMEMETEEEGNGDEESEDEEDDEET